MFTSNFWKALFVGFGAQLDFSRTYHPQVDHQSERVNNVMKDTLRMYVIHQPKRWEELLLLVESIYNNGYQGLLKMTPFKKLYNNKCDTPIILDDPINRALLRLNMLKEMKQEVINVRQQLKVSHYRRKSDAYQQRMCKKF